MNRQSKTKDIVYLILLASTLALCIALTVMLGVFGAKVAGTQKYIMSHECAAEPAQPPEDTETQQAISTAERLYVLGVKDGRLTIYAADGYTVIDTLDTYVYSLPLSDREAVSAGISVYSVNELVSLIEDYTS